MKFTALIHSGNSNYQSDFQGTLEQAKSDLDRWCRKYGAVWAKMFYEQNGVLAAVWPEIVTMSFADGMSALSRLLNSKVLVSGTHPQGDRYDHGECVFADIWQVGDSGKFGFGLRIDFVAAENH